MQLSPLFISGAFSSSQTEMLRTLKISIVSHAWFHPVIYISDPLDICLLIKYIIKIKSCSRLLQLFRFACFLFFSFSSTTLNVARLLFEIHIILSPIQFWKLIAQKGKPLKFPPKRLGVLLLLLVLKVFPYNLLWKFCRTPGRWSKTELPLSQ